LFKAAKVGKDKLKSDMKRPYRDKGREARVQLQLKKLAVKSDFIFLLFLALAVKTVS